MCIRDSFCIRIIYDALYWFPVGLGFQPCRLTSTCGCICETLKVPLLEILSLEGRHRIHYLFYQWCTLLLFCCVYCCLHCYDPGFTRFKGFALINECSLFSVKQFLCLVSHLLRFCESCRIGYKFLYHLRRVPHTIDLSLIHISEPTRLGMISY